MMSTDSNRSSENRYQRSLSAGTPQRAEAENDLPGATPPAAWFLRLPANAQAASPPADTFGTGSEAGEPDPGEPDVSELDRGQPDVSEPDPGQPDPAVTGAWVASPAPESGESPISWYEGMDDPGPEAEPPAVAADEPPAPPITRHHPHHPRQFRAPVARPGPRGRLSGGPLPAAGAGRPAGGQPHPRPARPAGRAGIPAEAPRSRDQEGDRWPVPVAGLAPPVERVGDPVGAAPRERRPAVRPRTRPKPGRGMRDRPSSRRPARRSGRSRTVPPGRPASRPSRRPAPTRPCGCRSARRSTLSPDRPRQPNRKPGGSPSGRQAGPPRSQPCCWNPSCPGPGAPAPGTRCSDAERPPSSSPSSSSSPWLSWPSPC